MTTAVLGLKVNSNPNPNTVGVTWISVVDRFLDECGDWFVVRDVVCTGVDSMYGLCVCSGST